MNMQANETVLDNARQSLIESAVKDLTLACQLEDKAKVLTNRALKGIAGYICGNHAIDLALEILEKIPTKTRKKVALQLEIYLGYFHHLDKDINGTTVYKMPERLFTIGKLGATCNIEALQSADKAEKNAAYEALCAKRKKLPDDMASVKIKELPANDEAKCQLEKLAKQTKVLWDKRSTWNTSPSAKRLELVIQALADSFSEFELDCLSYEDRRILATSRNITGNVNHD